MKNDKNLCLFFLFWGLQISGLLGIFAFVLELVRFFLFHKPIFWDRSFIVLVIGGVLFLIGKKYAKKYAS
jgi:hypothetical protein